MNDTDRELLELAAKAAGIRTTEGNDYWNPLEDDGDAFRLAVKLGLKIKGIEILIIEDDLECDRLTATRRAIVLAAAGIGREMK